jgi:hypothetical protein
LLRPAGGHTPTHNTTHGTEVLAPQKHNSQSDAQTTQHTRCLTLHLLPRTSSTPPSVSTHTRWSSVSTCQCDIWGVCVCGECMLTYAKRAKKQNPTTSICVCFNGLPPSHRRTTRTSLAHTHTLTADAILAWLAHPCPNGQRCLCRSDDAIYFFVLCEWERFAFTCPRSPPPRPFWRPRTPFQAPVS